MFTRLQWRIAISYIALITVVLFVLGLYLAQYLRQQQLDALEDPMGRQAQLLAYASEQPLTERDQRASDALAKTLGRQIHSRVTLIAADGTVLGDSEHDPATMDNHATRPEVRAALSGGLGESQRHSITLEDDLLYVAVPVEHDGAVVGVARVAMPVDAIHAASNRVVMVLALATLVAAILITAMSIGLARLTTGRIERVTFAARQLASGDLDHLIPIEGRDEVSVVARAFNDMAGALRTHISNVELERNRLTAVLQHMTDGVIITDGRAEVQLINPAAVAMLQLASGPVQGVPLANVVRDHELSSMVHSMLDAAGPDIDRRLVTLGWRGHGRMIWAGASRIPAREGQSQRALLMLQDVTELRRTETLRKEFVANVSHELRTPVAALKALVETLEDGALDDRDASLDFLARMHVEVDGLAQLVEELLALSRIESGRDALRFAPMDIGDAVVAAAERLRPQAERLGVMLEILPPAGATVVNADADRMRQVVVNLVHNGVKFTPPGGRVRVAVERQEAEVTFSVADTGIGVDPAILNRLFERFFKADHARSSGGTGLGLAIAKHIVQAHGGRIWAESPGEGQGTTFFVALPTDTPIATS
jgi:two-component system phosphate regulon sensor histidine kinase PhoR